MKVKKLAAFILSLVCSFPALALAQTEPLSQPIIAFDFAGEKGADGWSRTKQASLETSAESLRYAGTGWDAKLYRAVKLSKGNYRISGRARGLTMLQLRRAGEMTERPLVNLNLTRDDWRTDWRQFETEGGDLVLVISFGAAGETKGEIQWIKIEEAPVLPEVGIPDAAALEIERPSPEIVRGFVTGNSTDRETYAAMHALGANVVRLVIDPQKYIKKDKIGLWDAMPHVLDQLEAQVKCAQAEGLKSVPVLCGQIVEGKSNSHEIWDHPDLETNFCRIWELVAKRLAPYRESIWAFDLYNEALDWEQMPYAPRQWRPLAIAGIKAIRAIDRNAWVIYETGPGSMSSGFDGLKPLPDTHVIYGAHFYSPQEFTHQGVSDIAGTDLAAAMEKINVRYPGKVNGHVWNKGEMEKDLASTVAFQKKYRAPIYFGEFSVIRWAPKEDAVRWLTDVIDIFEANGWSWCYHGFREFNGWSFEHDESLWTPGMPLPAAAANETERAKVVKAGLRKNQAGAVPLKGAAEMPEPGKDAPAAAKAASSAWSQAEDAAWKKRVKEAGGVAASLQQTVSNEKTRISAEAPKAYASTTKLKEMKHLAPGSLDPASLVIRGAGRDFAIGTDVLLDPVWGGLGLASGGALGPQDEVEISYRLSSRRVDALVRDREGRERIRPGTSHLINPALPAILDGDTLLAHVFVDYHSDGGAFEVLPVLATAAKAPTATTGPARLPATVKKLAGGQALKIVCWGDSVTEGGDVGLDERYGGQLAASLKKKFPSATVEVMAVGGSHSRQWLLDLPPAQQHRRKEETRFQRILDAKPDLVVVEFVNDQWMSKADTLALYRTKIIAPLRAAGTELLLLTPQHNWDRKGSFRDPDTREYVACLREMGHDDEGVGVADMAGRWEHLWREGIPYPVYLANGFNHPDVRGHTLFTEEILRALGVDK